MQNGVLIILIISVLGPIIGSFIGVVKRPSRKFMYNMLAFAGGVMLAISFLNLIPESIQLSSVLICIIGVIVGSITMYMIDKLIPHIHPGLCCSEHGREYKLKKSVAFLMIGIFLHNFPEGMAIAIPFHFAGMSKLRTAMISFAAGITTLVGAMIAFLLLGSLSERFMYIGLAFAAGAMFYITVNELIPEAHRYGNARLAGLGVLTGVLVVFLLTQVS